MRRIHQRLLASVAAAVAIVAWNGASPALASQDESRRASLAAQVAYTTFDTEPARKIELPRQVAEQLTGTRVIASASQIECWTLEGYVAAYNVFGNTLWRFYLEADWCGNFDTRKVIYTDWRTWANVYVYNWSYKGLVDDWTSGGVNYPSWTIGAQGKMCFQGVWGCIQEKYPWIEYYLKWNGDYSTDGHQG